MPLRRLGTEEYSTRTEVVTERVVETINETPGVSVRSEPVFRALVRAVIDADDYHDIRARFRTLSAQSSSADDASHQDEVTAVIDALTDALRADADFIGERMRHEFRSIARAMLTADKPYTPLDLHYAVVDDTYLDTLAADADDEAVRDAATDLAEYDDADLHPLRCRVDTGVLTPPREAHGAVVDKLMELSGANECYARERRVFRATARALVRAEERYTIGDLVAVFVDADARADIQRTTQNTNVADALDRIDELDTERARNIVRPIDDVLDEFERAARND